MATEKKQIDFMKLRRIAMLLSAIALLASLGSLFTKQLSFGLDFTGGTQIEVLYDESVALADVRQTLEQAGFEGVVVVNFGSDRDVLVRMPQGVEESLGLARDAVGTHVVEILEAASPVAVELRRIEFVGPQVGEELREQGGLAMLLALGVVMLYVAFRFQFKFSVGAVVALIHDVLIVLGVFSILQLDFDLTVLAALLAVIGYSLNDTIVVSDRVRENFRKLRIENPVAIINISLNETLGRTLVTSLTTMLVLGALFLLGGEIIHNFSLALLIGVAVGTYSSIYVAANTLLIMGLKREDLLIPTREELDDGRP